jgi:hypothetical protein
MTERLKTFINKNCSHIMREPQFINKYHLALKKLL